VLTPADVRELEVWFFLLFIIYLFCVKSNFVFLGKIIIQKN
jgi:hypothetical protein